MKVKLRIPIARSQTTGELVLPHLAIKSQGPFWCVDCNTKVSHRKETKIRCAHFAHKTQHVCGGESAQHLAAKYIIAEHFVKFMFRDKCCGCNSVLTTIDNTNAVDISAKTEYRVDKYVVDVALFTKGTLCAIVEIHHTHAVDQEKWTALRALCANVFEVRAMDVITVFAKNPLAQQFSVVCKTEYVKICSTCRRWKQGNCSICFQSELKQNMQLVQPNGLCCMTCVQKSRQCQMCQKSGFYWHFSLCLHCQCKLNSLFPNCDHKVQLARFHLFRRLVRRVQQRRATQIQGTIRQLTTQIQSGYHFFALDVPHEDCRLAELAGCVFQNGHWRVSGTCAWRSYLWWPDKKQKAIMGRIAPNNVDDVGFWNDDRRNTMCARCENCGQYNVQSQLREFLIPVPSLLCESWICDRCATFIKPCSICFCDDFLGTNQTCCQNCNARLAAMFPHIKCDSRVRIYYLFKRIAKRLHVQLGKKLLQRIEDGVVWFPLNVPHIDSRFAKFAGCHFHKGSWYVRGPSVWRCYRWWPNPHQIELIKDIGSTKQTTIDIWNDDAMRASHCVQCTTCRLNFIINPTDSPTTLCSDCKPKPSSKVPCNECKSFIPANPCNCQNGHRAEKQDDDIHIQHKKPKHAPYTFVKVARLILTCRRAAKRFIVNRNTRFAEKARLWFHWSIETDACVRIHVPDREVVFALFANCFFDPDWNGWHIRGQKQLFMCARWLPQKYLRSFAMQHRELSDVPFWENTTTLHTFDVECGRPLLLNSPHAMVMSNEQYERSFALDAAERFLAKPGLRDTDIVATVHRMHSDGTQLYVTFANAIQFLLVKERILDI